jgi:hypothetical protein
MVLVGTVDALPATSPRLRAAAERDRVLLGCIQPGATKLRIHVSAFASLTNLWPVSVVQTERPAGPPIGSHPFPPRQCHDSICIQFCMRYSCLMATFAIEIGLARGAARCAPRDGTPPAHQAALPSPANRPRRTTCPLTHQLPIVVADRWRLPLPIRRIIGGVSYTRIPGRDVTCIRGRQYCIHSCGHIGSDHATGGIALPTGAGPVTTSMRCPLQVADPDWPAHHLTFVPLRRHRRAA